MTNNDYGDDNQLFEYQHLYTIINGHYPNDTFKLEVLMNYFVNIILFIYELIWQFLKEALLAAQKMQKISD